MEKGVAVTEKNTDDSGDKSPIHYRPGPFTRMNLALGVLCYSVLPVLLSWPAIRAHRLTIYDWEVIAVEVMLLQVALWFATVRCGSKELPFWQGMTLVAAYMRTGWLYTDLLVGGISVMCVLIIADCIALTPKARPLYYRMLHAFYRHRLTQ